MIFRKSHSRGFTLIELLVVLAIVAILAALAWPAFTDAVNKSRRSDAMSALANITQAQERWRANNPDFQSNLSKLVGATSDKSPGGHYALKMSNVSPTGYTANATVRSTSQASDTACQVMQVEMLQGNIIYRSGPDSTVGNKAPDPCWVR